MPDVPLHESSGVPLGPADKPDGLWTKKRAALLVGGLVIVVLLFSVIGGQRQPSVSEYEREHPVQAPTGIDQFGQSIGGPLQRPPQKSQDEEALEEWRHEQIAAANKKGDNDGQLWQQQNAMEQQAEIERRRKAQEALAASNIVMSFRSQTENTAATAATPESTAQQGQTQQSVPTTPPHEESGAAKKKPVTYDVNSATGKTYRIFEGTLLPCTLMNRVNGALAGPIKCLVNEPVLDHSHERVLIPQGSVLLGDVTQVSSTNQERLFVAFHRCIMEPDGYSLSLDQFKGLSQIGETGVRDKVNHHYFQIFGASLAIAAVSGLAEIGSYGTGGVYSVGDQYRAGVTLNLAESSMQVLNRFLNLLPTFVVREGARLRVYISDDLLVPDAKNHTMPGDI